MLATLALGALIVVGSRRLSDFDSALVGYTFACLFATFGIVYRYSVYAIACLVVLLASERCNKYK